MCKDCKCGNQSMKDIAIDNANACQEAEEAKMVDSMAKKKRPYISNEMMDKIEGDAERRLKATGSLKMDDYFCGAMSALYTLGYEMPPRWVFGIMRGEIGNIEIKGKTGMSRIKSLTAR
jgi:hypothetical protein